MSSKPTAPLEQPIEMIEVNSPEHKEIYANGTMVRMSPWDIGIIFSQQKAPNIRENQVTLTMSPNHFKAFASAMKKTLEAYESQFGTINVPENLMLVGMTPKISDESPKVGKHNAKKSPNKKAH
jgi:hypothetical protein